MSKIVRVTVSVKDDLFYIDRPFDAARNDFENCDSAMAYLKDMYDKNHVISAMLMRRGATVIENGKPVNDPFYGAQPALINLINVAYIAIRDVAVYQSADEAGEDKKDDVVVGSIEPVPVPEGGLAE